jgi:hypothetical protein
MPEYRVVVNREVLETYHVEAASEEEASDNPEDGELVAEEKSAECDVVSVEEIEPD